MLLTGKAAVVTGSSKGLGRAFVTALAAEGANVVVNGATNSEDVVRVVDEIKSAGGNAVGCLETVATMTGAKRIIQTAVDNFGRLDILVNNAGVLRDRTFMKMTEEEWDTVIAVHLKGTFACSKFAAAVMSQQGGGCIINITSGGVWEPVIGQSNYSAAKAGIIGFTTAIALEMARYNIRVNAVAPRGLTRMNMPLMERIARTAGEQATPSGSTMPTALDLGYGDPKLLGPAIVFLASNEAKDITGTIFNVQAETISVISRNEEIASATMINGWTLDELRKRFRIFLGQVLDRR